MFGLPFVIGRVGCWCLCRRVYRSSRGALGTARTEAEGLARAQAPPGADAWAKRRANHAADAHTTGWHNAVCLNKLSPTGISLATLGS